VGAFNHLGKSLSGVSMQEAASRQARAVSPAHQTQLQSWREAA
jgi:hypothetical protein